MQGENIIPGTWLQKKLNWQKKANLERIEVEVSIKDNNEAVLLLLLLNIGTASYNLHLPVRELWHLPDGRSDDLTFSTTPARKQTFQSLQEGRDGTEDTSPQEEALATMLFWDGRGDWRKTFSLAMYMSLSRWENSGVKGGVGHFVSVG